MEVAFSCDFVYVIFEEALKPLVKITYDNSHPLVAKKCYVS